MNSGNTNQPQFFQIQQQNYNPVSNQQSFNLSSNSPTSSTSLSQNQNQEPQRIPKKRGRKPKPKPTDQNSVMNISISNPSLMSTRTRSSSQNQTGNNNDDGNNSAEESESEYDEQDNEGIPINAILCKTLFPFQPLIQNLPAIQTRNSGISANISASQSSSNLNNQNNSVSRSSSVQNFDPNEPQYLVKMQGQAPIHSFIICEHSIKNGSQSGKLLNEFKRSCEYNKVKISSVGIGFLEPCSMEKHINVDSFGIDQIIAHRTFESETKFMEKIMDDNLHIPGLPTDFFPPNFEEVFKYSNTFLPNHNEAYSLLRDDGFFTFGESNANGNQILTKDLFKEYEHDDEQITDKSYNTNSNDNENINQNNVNNSNDDSTFKIPQKIEFKVQWKGLSVSESTWESYESLVNSIRIHNEFEQEENITNLNNNLYNKYLLNGTIIRQNLFCPTNIDELENLINDYWSRVVIFGGKNGSISSNSLNPKDEMIPIENVPNIIPQMRRQTTLTETQQCIIKQLFGYKINFINSRSYDNASNGFCQVLQLKNSGRVFALVGYLQMLYSIYHLTKPSIIIVNEKYAQVWKDALKSISNLFWVDFSGSSSDRMMIKHHRLDKKSRFDVLITSCHVLEKESDFLKTFQWDNIIIDDIHLKQELLLINSQNLSGSNEYALNIVTRKRRGRRPKNATQRSIYERNENNEEYSSNEKENDDDSENVNENDEEKSDEDNENILQSENSKNEENNILDSSLTNRSHSLSVLASSLLKSRNAYTNRNRKKNNSPFVILLNDLFSFSPVFNQMAPIDEIAPFHFTETIFIVPNLINQYTYKKLSILFKKRAARVLNMGKAVDILNELILSLQHPFIIPEIHNELFKDYVSSRGLNNQKLNPSIELEFLRSICGKLSILDELTIGTREKALSISIIVAEDLAILKLLRLYFDQRKIPAGIVNTNVANERVPDDFAYGILLMNRDITHPLIDKFTISQIIFYDVSTSYKKDLDFIQFITRQQNSALIANGQTNFPQINIYRLLTKHSLETELFIKTTLPAKPDSPNLFSFFDYKDLTIRTAEPLIRAAVLASKEAEKEREEQNSAYSQFQFPYQPQNSVQKAEPVTSFNFEFPTGNDALSSLLNSIMSQTERDEFWAFAFQSSTVAKTELTDFSNYVYNFEDEAENNEVEKPPENNENALSPEYRLYIELLKNGMNSWELIAATINKPVEEVMKIGRAMILKMLSNIKPTDIFNFTLASNIYWFEYSDSFAHGHQLDEPEFWARIADSKSNQVNSPLFNNPCFLISQSTSNVNNLNQSKTVFDGIIGERNLKCFEENYIVRTFLTIRSFPYIPTRLLAKKGSVMYTPEYIYAFLKYYTTHTGDWESIKTKFHLNLYSTDAIINYFKELYNSILSDLFSFILHRVYSGERQVLIEKDKILWPLLQVLEQGPFTMNWNESEINVITSVLSNFRVPLAGQSVEDWCEFHSLTRLLTKSTESVEFMTSYIIEGIAELQDNSKFVIIPDLTFSEPISIPPNVTKKIKLRMSTMLYVQQLSREEKLKQFSPQVSMPDNWTDEDDHSLVKGICQFGYNNLFNLGKINVALYNEKENGEFCAIMTKDLSNFSSFFEERSAFLMRLKLIITSNADVSQNWASLINEQLSDNANKANVPHRRGRPPNPNKHKETTTTATTSTTSSSARRVGRPRTRPLPPTPTTTTTATTENMNVTESAATVSASGEEGQNEDTINSSQNEEETHNLKKNKKHLHLTQKQQKLEDETVFTPENEDVDDDDDEYGENDSEENEFDRRLRARPMATRARASLENGQSSIMQTRNHTKKQEKKEEKKKGKEKQEKDQFDVIIEEIPFEDVNSENNKNERIVEKPKEKVKKAKNQVQKAKVKIEENEDDSPKIMETRSKSSSTTRKKQAQRVRNESDDEDDFVYSDEEEIDEAIGNGSSSNLMQTRSRSIPTRSRNQIKTRSQLSKQEAPVKKENKIIKVKNEKNYRQIAFVFDPIPDAIKFIPH
ncbi:hypothetical protein M9Y10_046045 [Tritrichomonas musculus]|uniref:Chromo domain-containing protein n=1 Tax=Tritrichomonas musculus TaxID=1915356 RepID=A0ABR2JX05_9EUKA